ncbi:hypothetical protein [uncultured Bacteroides sp.]|uniref:hypothetical protein n=1 Tax=uncultured Bacteroides sp. TaxID=162156 RepID=UPI0025F8F043|nr:hypothetical protein [uncultured Bacteroides sp.]
MRNYLFLSAVAAMMLTACSNDETLPMESPAVTQPGQTLTLTLNSSGDGLNTVIGTTAVAAIRITLYTRQNKSVPLLQRSQTPVFKDYITSPLAASTNGHVLVQIPVPAGTLPAATLSKRAYVLPVPAPTAVNNGDYTLKVEIADAAGNTLRSTRVTLSGSDDTNSSTGNGTGIIDPQGVYRFPLIANHFYGIGTPLAPVNLGTMETKNDGIRAKMIKEWGELD